VLFITGYDRVRNAKRLVLISEGLVEVELLEEGRILPGRWRNNESNIFIELSVVFGNKH
jgi:hypothetical protein